MVNQDKICHFHNGTGYCSILYKYKTTKVDDNIKRCSGWDNDCKFAKTTQQFIDDGDKSIYNCRCKNLCSKCKYVESVCKLSTEV